MRTIYLLLLSFLSVYTSAAQSPEKMSYQAVIRNSNGLLVQNQQVGVRISILQGAINGTEVFAETHTLSTNVNGLLSLEIGSGTNISGSLQSIDWSANQYFVRTQTDPNGGSNYSIDGVSQLLTVPYAFYADSAGNSFSGDYQDLTNVPSNLSDFNNDQGFLNAEADGDPNNELQVLSISNDTLFLSNGGFAVLPSTFDGQYSSLTGAPSTVSAFANDAGYLITEADGDSTNELQTLSLSNDTVYLTNGGSVTLPPNFDGQYSSLTGAPSTVSAFTNDVGYLINEVDGDSSNELQTLSIANDSISISQGNTLALPSGLWSANGSNIYYNQGNVGIGTTTPCASCKLEVHGNIHLKGSGDFVAWSPDETSTKAVMFADNGSVRMGAQGGALRLLSNSSLSNTERMRITTSGDVGIGTTSPDEKLHLTESGSNSTAIRLEQSGTGGREYSLVSTGAANSAGAGNFFITDETANQTRFSIDGSGNVGVGTSDPEQALHVVTPGGGEVFIETGQSTNSSMIRFSNSSGSDAFAINMSNFIDNQPTATLGWAAGNGANRHINFRTNGSNHMVIKGDGRIGIGLTDPCSSCKLEVNGNINTRNGGDINAWSPDGISSHVFMLAANGSGRIGTKGGPMVFTSHANVNSSSGSSERMRLTSNGQLGIGTGANVSTDNNVLLHIKNPSNANTGIQIESGNGDEWQMYAHTNDHWGIYEVDAAASRFIVDSGGNVGVGTLSPTAKLSVNGSASKPGGGSWAVFSDRRLKQNIQPYNMGLSTILQINPVTFQYNGVAGIADTETEHVGIVAQEMQELAPKTVRTVEVKEGEFLEFDPSSLDFMMINAIQELNEKIETLQQQMKQLEAENTALKEQ